MCCDVYKNLYIPQPKSFWHYEMPQLDPAETRMLVNVVGIVTFDSPLFGLNHSLARLVVPKSVTLLPALIPTDVADLIPDNVKIPVVQDFSVGI
jgi:hypothetical protein